MARFTLALSLALLALAAGEAAAAPFNLVSVRRVEIGTSSGPLFSPTSNTAGPFSAAVSHPVAASSAGLLGVFAAQSTLVDGGAGLLAGTGSASVDYSVLASLGIYASSFFDVSFDLSSPHGYSLVGDLAASSDGGYAWAGLSLSGPIAFSFMATPFVQSTPLSSSGVLPAGSYRLVVEAAMDNGGNSQAGASMGGSSAFDVEFRLTPRVTPVAEPLSLTMLAVGVTLVAWRRRVRI